ncbi:transposase, partial [Pectinatus frisingensis]|uniref:transposase n=1 Tax=Pectinatus frisingensis TaxID=865 RepID=UPI0018C5B5A2
FADAIGAVYPEAEVQRCIVHQIRYTTKFIYYKDMKPFVQDLKAIYQAPTLEQAEVALDALEEKWNNKYPLPFSHGGITGRSYPLTSNIHWK